MILRKLAIVIMGITITGAGCASMLNAVESGNLKKVQKLVEKGEDPDQKRDCTSPLVLAAEKGQLEIVRYLLEKGANPNVRLSECSRRSSIGRYRVSGHTALYWSRSLEITKLLLDKGANPNLVGSKEFSFGYVRMDTPLLRAFRSRNYETAKLLLSRGAKTNFFDSEGKNWLKLIVKHMKKPQNAKKFKKLISKYRVKDLDVSLAAQKRTESKVRKTYRHVQTKAITTMSDEIANRLFNRPKSLSEITMSAPQNAYWHTHEFVWEDNGQNLHEWIILRRLYKKKKK